MCRALLIWCLLVAGIVGLANIERSSGHIDEAWKGPCIGCSDLVRFVLAMQGPHGHEAWVKTAYQLNSRYDSHYQRNTHSAYWQSRDANYNTTIGTGGFQGPGDVASGAIGFWSCGRAYNKAYALANSAACDLVDTTTGLATCTLSIDDDGFANLQAVVCPTAVPVVNVVTFCTVTHNGCSVTKMYDQTGTGNHVVQATLANMPGLTLSAQNGLPCPAGTGNAAVRLAMAGSISQAAPFTETAVVERTGNFTTLQKISSNGANVATLNFTASANTISSALGGNAINLTANDSSPHALLGVVSATAPLFAIDSSANTSTSASGTTALAGAQLLMGRSTGAQGLLTGFVCEQGIWPADLNASYQTMLANMRAAWGF